MRFISSLIAAIALLTSSTLHADVLVLVHGYLANANTWEHSGINKVLEENGWKRGGLFTQSPTGPQLLETKDKEAENTVYIVDLPSDAPIIVQSDLLNGMLSTIRQRQPDEPLIIVGHSAGGVVARMSLVRTSGENISALITIASPHIGTTRAEQAIHATNESGPFGMVKSAFGGSGYDAVKRSRGLLFDLTRPYPGNMLYWLNSQKHPDISYYSVVRLNPVGFAGDELVPGFSQDMNNVPVLQSQCSVVTTPAGHTLVTQDANTILDILNQLNTKKS
jgi:pimeloyl-ACP methyl ester carboxylesterase